MGFPPLKLGVDSKPLTPGISILGVEKRPGYEFLTPRKGWKEGRAQERLQEKTPTSDISVNPWDGSTARHYPRIK